MHNQNNPKPEFWQMDWFEEWDRLAKKDYLDRIDKSPLLYSDVEKEIIKKELSNNDG